MEMKNQATPGGQVSIGYGYGKSLTLPFSAAVTRAKEALKAEGFGILCEIDVREKMKEKLGVDFKNYLILGACNPPLAYQTLQQDPNIGLLLPCNVVVYDEGGRSVVAAIDALKMLSIVDSPELAPTAEKVNEKLRRVIDSV